MNLLALGIAVQCVTLLVALVALVRTFTRVDASTAALKGFAYAEQWASQEAKRGHKPTSAEKRIAALEAAKRLAPKLSHAVLHTALEAEIHRSKK